MLLLTTIIFLFYRFFWQTHFRIEEELNPTHVIEYFFRDPSSDYQAYLRSGATVMGRGKAVTESFRLISGSFKSFLFGFGSGSTSKSEFLDLRGKHFYEYGPEAGLGRTQYSKIMAEYGFIGFLLFISFFIYILRKSKKVKKVSNENLSYDLYFVLLINIGLLSFYGPLLQSSISLLILACLIGISQIELINTENRQQRYKKSLHNKDDFLHLDMR
jgi:hypothetical protein